ncbi:MAG: hypothetical protein ACQEP3_02825 [Patescibacteria group bacterium]
MQIFELHFNPKNKDGKQIDTFCYQPEDVYEKRLGALAIGGELTKGASNKTLLNNLASKIKGTYHALPTRSQEEALREGLKEGNKFLKKEEWGGDLNVAILSIKSNRLQFSKLGKLKILLSRNGQITDIGKNAEEGEDSFGSIVTGKIKKEDKLIVLTKEIYKHFVNEDLLIDLAEDQTINDEKLERISKVQKNKFPKVPGICLLVDFSIETASQEKIINKDEFSFRKTFIKAVEETQKVSTVIFNNIKEGILKFLKFVKENGKPALKNALNLTKAVLKDIKKAASVLLSSIQKEASNGIKVLKEKRKDKKKKKEQKKQNKNEEVENNEVKTNNEAKEWIKIKDKKQSFLKNFSKLKTFLVSESKKSYENLKKLINKLKSEDYFPDIPKFKIPDTKEKRRSLYLVGLLLIIILVGSLTAHSERSKQLEEQKATLSEIEEDISSIGVNDENSFEDLLYHYENLDDLVEKGIAYESEAKNLRSKASQKLLEISNTEIIEEPETLFQTTEIVPSKIELIGNELYTYNPFLASAEKYNLDNNQQLIKPVSFESGGIFSIGSTNDEILFFSKPNEIIISNDVQTAEKLAPPYEDYSYQQLESFQDNLYLLERQNNQIIRYNKNDLSNPEIWIEERMPGNITAFAIDGSIWALKENNEIWEYEANRPVQDSLIKHEKVFPVPERLSRIETNNDSPIYTLDPNNNRIIISSKEGGLLKQVILPNANNLKDLAIDQNKIYLLDSQEVYMIEVEL